MGKKETENELLIELCLPKGPFKNMSLIKWHNLISPCHTLAFFSSPSPPYVKSFLCHSQTIA